MQLKLIYLTLWKAELAINTLQYFFESNYVHFFFFLDFIKNYVLFLLYKQELKLDSRGGPTELLQEFPRLKNSGSTQVNT